MEQVTVYKTPLLTLDTNAAASGGLIEVIKLADHRDAIKREVADALDVSNQQRKQVADLQGQLEAAQVDNRAYVNERFENMKTIEALQAQVAQLTAERDEITKRWKVDFELRVELEDQLATLRGLVEALPILECEIIVTQFKEDQGAWAVVGPWGVTAAKFWFENRAQSYAALLRYRATLAQPKGDACQVCKGARGGVPGNENIVNGIVLCDYCHAQPKGAQ